MTQKHASPLTTTTPTPTPLSPISWSRVAFPQSPSSQHYAVQPESPIHKTHYTKVDSATPKLSDFGFSGGSPWAQSMSDSYPLSPSASLSPFSTATPSPYLSGMDAYRALASSVHTKPCSPMQSPFFGGTTEFPYRGSSELSALSLYSDDGDLNDLKVQQIAEFALPEEDRLQSSNHSMFEEEERSFVATTVSSAIADGVGKEELESQQETGDISAVEYPSRTLLMSRAANSISDTSIKTLFGVQNVRNVYRIPGNDDLVVTFFDIRKAKEVMQMLQQAPPTAALRDSRFSFLKEPPTDLERNQGTLVVFNLDSSLSKEHLKVIFGRFGEILEIRETPNKKHHRFVEFYDVRHAEAALLNLNRTEIKGKKIKIEVSRPGGIRSRTSGSYEDEDESRLRSPSLQSPMMSYVSPTLTPSPTLSVASNATILSPMMMPQQIPTDPHRSYQMEHVLEVDYGPRLQHVARAPSQHHDPKYMFKVDIYRIMNGEDGRTTCMIRNIPNKYTQKMLLAKIDEDFRETYDFFYLPIDFKNDCNVGYAFINFISPLSIPQFHDAFAMKRWEKFNSDKIIDITYARIQGKMQLIIHFQNSSILSEDKKCRPVLFHSAGPLKGKPEEFPIILGPRHRMTGLNEN
eukprot:TRINITY_DN86_c0_g1_i7.p1 TRINITY_DN86_c0_g1~~TRINITY_DN86_c0_g1_i7.p1  ORF type:complete len:632 (-),score=134.12 TRINITY_DN86_c0_g1_i7:295-2190(-)